MKFNLDQIEEAMEKTFERLTDPIPLTELKERILDALAFETKESENNENRP